MADYPYVMTLGKVPALFKTVGEKGIPAKVDNKWLSQFGMGSSNDRRFIPLLKFIGFIDDKGAPTGRWRAYRGADSRKVMGEAIREGYAGLFADHPNAQDISSDELTVYFKSHSGNDAGTIARVASTFRALVGLADFATLEVENTDRGREAEAPDAVEEETPQQQQPPNSPPTRKDQQSIVINVNLQLTLPNTDNPQVFDALFASLKKHVLAGNNEQGE